MGGQETTAEKAVMESGVIERKETIGEKIAKYFFPISKNN